MNLEARKGVIKFKFTMAFSTVKLVTFLGGGQAKTHSLLLPKNWICSLKHLNVLNVNLQCIVQCKFCSLLIYNALHNASWLFAVQNVFSDFFGDIVLVAAIHWGLLAMHCNSVPGLLW